MTAVRTTTEPPKVDGDLTFDTVTQGAANFCIDLTCGSCACIFFTGYGGYGHAVNCKTEPPRLGNGPSSNRPQPLSIREAAKQAIDMQDACNASGIIHTLSTQIMPAVMAHMNERKQSTRWANSHPIVYIVLYKLLDLSAPEQSQFIAFAKPYELVKRLATGAKPEEVY